MLLANNVNTALKPNIIVMKFENTITAPYVANRVISGNIMVAPIKNAKKFANDVNATLEQAIRIVSAIISCTVPPNPNATNDNTWTIFEPKPLPS